MIRKRALVLGLGFALAVALGLVAIAGPGAPGAQAQETHQVTAAGCCSWDTTTVQASAGDTVEWDFAGGGHDICIDDSAPVGPAGFGDCGDDELLGSFENSDSGGEKTFTEAGSYPFYCSFHYPGMEGTVEVAEGGGGSADLRASVKPKRKTVNKRAGQAAFTFNVRNVGDAATGPLTLCAKAPKKRLKVKGAACRGKQSLAGGAQVSTKFKFKIKRAARGKTTKIAFTAAGEGVDGQRVVARLKVKG